MAIEASSVAFIRTPSSFYKWGVPLCLPAPLPTYLPSLPPPVRGQCRSLPGCTLAAASEWDSLVGEAFLFFYCVEVGLFRSCALSFVNPFLPPPPFSGSLSGGDGRFYLVVYLFFWFRNPYRPDCNVQLVHGSLSV